MLFNDNGELHLHRCAHKFLNQHFITMRAAFENIAIDKSGDLPSGTYFEFHAKYFKKVDVTFEFT